MRRSLATFAFLTMLLGATSVAGGHMDTGSPLSGEGFHLSKAPEFDDGVVTTLPLPEGEASGEGFPRYAVEKFADEFDVSFSVAEQMLEQQSRLVDYAERARKEPGYAGFEVVNEPPEVRGVLAVTPGSELVPSEDLVVTVVRSRIAEEDLLQLSEDVRLAFHEAGHKDVVGVTYDPFQDDVVVWISSSATSRPTVQEARAVVADTQGPNFADVGVRFDKALGEPTYGGRKATNSQGATCTTGFGVTKEIDGALRGAYLTAGHCRAIGGNSGWVVHHPTGLKTITHYYNQSLGGYRDRVMMRGNGVEWWVRTSSTTREDMQATPGHIFQGVFYCHYGWVSNSQWCSTIKQVNFVLGGFPDGKTVYASRADGAACTGGDSGGPVWRPLSGSPSRPVGIITGAVGLQYPDNDCLYVALDDQLSGTGWQLLWNASSVPVRADLSVVMSSDDRWIIGQPEHSGLG